MPQRPLSYSYAFVISRRPDLKDGIDTYLIEHGHADLIEVEGSA